MNIKKAVLSFAAGIAVCGAGTAFAQCGSVDQSDHVNNAYMAGFAQGDLAQSFQTQSATGICGAGILLQAGIGTSDNVIITLYGGGLPGQGGTYIASNTSNPVVGTQGTWCYVAFDEGCVSITANTTYYLVFTGNTTLGIAGDVTNNYPYGQVYANSGFGSFPGFDYDFETYSCGGGGNYTLSTGGTCPGTVQVSWSGATPNAQQALVFGLNQGSTTVPSGPCAGTQLGLAGHIQQVGALIGTGPNGSGSLNANAPTFACGHYLQLVQGGTCATSNVAQIP